MNKNPKKLHLRTYPIHLAAFLSMLVSSFLMYFAAESDATGLLWLFLGIFVLGNILVLIVR